MRTVTYCTEIKATPLKGYDFVLLGIEDRSVRKVTAVYPQAWWCKVAIERPRASLPFDDGDAL